MTHGELHDELEQIAHDLLPALRVRLDSQVTVDTVIRMKTALRALIDRVERDVVGQREPGDRPTS